MPAECLPTVLVAEDEVSLAELYAVWLEPDYAVRMANDGKEALELVDDTIDVMLLDRQMPKLSGDAVLDALDDGDCSCRVAMITAVEPNFDILDLDCDEYLTKPVSKDELRATVDRLLRLKEYDEQLQSYYALFTKKAILDTQKSADEVANSPEYQNLVDQIAELREQLDATISDSDDEEFTRLFQDLRVSPSSVSED